MKAKPNSHMMYSKDETELCYPQIIPKKIDEIATNKPIKAKHKSSDPQKILRKEKEAIYPRSKTKD